MNMGMGQEHNLLLGRGLDWALDKNILGAELIDRLAGGRGRDPLPRPAHGRNHAEAPHGLVHAWSWLVAENQAVFTARLRPCLGSAVASGAFALSWANHAHGRVRDHEHLTKSIPVPVPCSVPVPVPSCGLGSGQSRGRVSGEGQAQGPGAKPDLEPVPTREAGGGPGVGLGRGKARRAENLYSTFCPSRFVRKPILAQSYSGWEYVSCGSEDAQDMRRMNRAEIGPKCKNWQSCAWRKGGLRGVFVMCTMNWTCVRPCAW